jgi:hypothetical protein
MKQESLAFIAIAGVLISTALVVALHLLRHDLDPVSRYESEYAVGPYSPLMTLVFVARGATAIALAWALYMSVQADWRSLAGTVLLAAFGVGMWVLALFPTDLRGAPDTTAGAIHNWVALAAFLSVTAATLLLSTEFSSDARWSPFAPVSWCIALLILASFLFFYAAPWLRIHGISGLTERIFIALVMLWLLITSVMSFEF